MGPGLSSGAGFAPKGDSKSFFFGYFIPVVQPKVKDPTLPLHPQGIFWLLDISRDGEGLRNLMGLLRKN